MTARRSGPRPCSSSATDASPDGLARRTHPGLSPPDARRRHRLPSRGTASRLIEALGPARPRRARTGLEQPGGGGDRHAQDGRARPARVRRPARASARRLPRRATRRPAGHRNPERTSPVAGSASRPSPSPPRSGPRGPTGCSSPSRSGRASRWRSRRGRRRFVPSTHPIGRRRRGPEPRCIVADRDRREGREGRGLVVGGRSSNSKAP